MSTKRATEACETCSWEPKWYHLGFAGAVGVTILGVVLKVIVALIWFIGDIHGSLPPIMFLALVIVASRLLKTRGETDG